MKILIVMLIGFLLIQVQASAFEVICSCKKPCKQVVFKVFESEAGGPLMSVNTETGQIEGYPTVFENKTKEQIIYTLGDFVLIREGNNFKMSGSSRICGLLVRLR